MIARSYLRTVQALVHEVVSFKTSKSFIRSVTTASFLADFSTKVQLLACIIPLENPNFKLVMKIFINSFSGYLVQLRNISSM